MTFEKGWINKQYGRVERDARSWPSWMRRDSGIAVQREQPRTHAGVEGVGGEVNPDHGDGRSDTTTTPPNHRIDSLTGR